MVVDEEDWRSGECLGDSLDRMLAQFANNNHLDNTWQVKERFSGGRQEEFFFAVFGSA